MMEKVETGQMVLMTAIAGALVDADIDRDLGLVTDKLESLIGKGRLVPEVLDELGDSLDRLLGGREGLGRRLLDGLQGGGGGGLGGGLRGRQESLVGGLLGEEVNKEV